MRTQSVIMMGAALLLFSAGARAQDPIGQTAPPDATPTQDVPRIQPPAASREFAPVNQIDIGLRGTSFGANSDQARYQRYEDLRDGGTLDRFRFSKGTNSYDLKLQADHVGYRDQRFFGSYDNFRTVKATFEFNQTPLFYSDATQSLYTSPSPGVLTLPTGVQTGIQNKTTTLQNALLGTSTIDVQIKRSVSNFNLVYSATPHVDLNVFVKNTDKNGSQPMSAGFGFSAPVDEFAAPVDTRTTEFGSSLQYGDDRAYAKFAYEGSFFRNNISTLTWANPMRSLDSATAGPVNGQMSLWPDTDRNTVSASAGLNKLPAHTHASAFVSYGVLNNNNTLIPYTDNTALVSPTLPRATSEVDARVTAMNFDLTSRPFRTLWLSARYRQYELDNRTPAFVESATVTYDTSLTTGTIIAEPLGYTRHTFDADASYSPIGLIGLRAGYTREVIDRTFRWVDATTEDVGRASVDLNTTTWLTLRGVYEYRTRVGTPLNTAEMVAAGEQPGLGQYDIANRDRNRATGIVIVTPLSSLSFNASAGWQKDDYPQSYFGINDIENQIYSAGFDAVPIENKVSFGVTYGYERNTGLQTSRYAGHVATGLPPAFYDPRDDWYDSTADTAYSLNASLDILKIIPKTDLKVMYDYNKADSSYVYSLPAVTVLAAPQQLPLVTNETQRGVIDLLYHLTQHLGAGLAYSYNKYSVNDFSLGLQAAGGLVPSPASVATPSMMMLGYYYLPYTANTFWGRLTYYW